MSVSTLESAASRTALAEFFVRAESRARAELGLRQDFEAAAQRCNVEAVATFAGLTKDWEQHRTNPNAKRAQTLAEVMGDSLDLGDGPSMAEVMALVCAVAWSNEAKTLRARELINRMATTWAAHNVEVSA